MSRLKFWYIISAVGISIMAMLVCNIIYTNHVGNAAVRAGQHAVAQSQRQLCTVLVAVNDLYKQGTTPLAKQLSVKFQALVDAYHCEEIK